MSTSLTVSTETTTKISSTVNLNTTRTINSLSGSALTTLSSISADSVSYSPSESINLKLISNLALTNENNLYGIWTSWYAVFCVLEKRRKRSNDSFVEIFRSNISTLGQCDHLDINYNTVKSSEIKNETQKKIDKIKLELETKLEELKTENAAAIQRSTSFTWLALLIIIILFLVILLNDLLKAISYFKENYCFNIKNQNYSSISFKHSELRDDHSVFKKVAEKDGILFNHPYFKKMRHFN